MNLFSITNEWKGIPINKLSLTNVLLD